MTRLEDRQIIDLFYERSEQAISELDRKNGAAVRKTAANILRRTQDVEECTNDTYLGVWNTIPPQNPNSLISYVCRIARNLASVKYRSNTARKRNGQYDLVLDELAECIPSSVNVESELEAKELSAAVNRFSGASPRYGWKNGIPGHSNAKEDARALRSSSSISFQTGTERILL